MYGMCMLHPSPRAQQSNCMSSFPVPHHSTPKDNVAHVSFNIFSFYFFSFGIKWHLEPSSYFQLNLFLSQPNQNANPIKTNI